MHSPRFSPLLPAVLALTLLGCGSGSNTGTSPRTPAPSVPTVEGLAPAIGTAADSKPKAGSVTQSSYAGANGVTVDRVTATPTSISSSSWSLTVSGNDSGLLSEGDKRRNLAAINNSIFPDLPIIEVPLWLSTLSSNQDPDNDSVTSANIFISRETESSSDYLTFGFWSHSPRGTWDFTDNRRDAIIIKGVPYTGDTYSKNEDGTYTVDETGAYGRNEDGTYVLVRRGEDGILVETLMVSKNDDYQVGAFADGGDPFTQSNLPALTGSATYEGHIAAMSSLEDSEELLGRTADYNVNYNPAYGNVRLTAAFGNGEELGTISGTVSNIRLYLGGGTSEGGPQLYPYPGATLTFGAAPIGNSNSGFFTGAVTGSAGARTYTGNWGGQFHGNGEADDHPGRVAGTFGAKSSDGKMNLLGAFAADKEDE